MIKVKSILYCIPDFEFKKCSRRGGSAQGAVKPLPGLLEGEHG